MASSDAKPFPLKNTAYRVYFPLLDADGDLVEGMAGLDSEVSKDGATFANCTNEATEILTITHDTNDTTNTVTSANASNQATLNTLLNEIKADYNAHRVSTTFHDTADSTNVVSSADATDAATSLTLANEIKTDYNAHRSQADVHPHDDSANAVSSADATDEASCITLANEIKTDYNAHLTSTAGSGMAYLDLVQAEMNTDASIIVVKSTTTGAKTTPIVLYPVEDTDIRVNVINIEGSDATDQIGDAVWDEVLTGATHNIATSAGRRLRQIGAHNITDGTAQAGTAYGITLAAGESATDHIFNRNLIVILVGTGAGQTRTIVDYNGSTKIAVVDRNWWVNPDATSEYFILADDTPLVVDHGLAQAGAASTITLRSTASAINDTYCAGVIAIVAGTGKGQSRLITGYVGSTKVATITPDWVTNPDSTSVYIVMPYGCSCVGNIGTAALTQINEEIGITKNVALPKFDFYMVLSSNHVSAATGKTVTGQISKDGGAFASITNAITEVSDGIYTIASGLTQTEMNADVITLKFTATNCDQRTITIYPT